MKDQELIKTLSAFPIFSGADEGSVAEAAARCEVIERKKGEELLCGEPALYCVLSGKAKVCRVDGGQSVILNSIQRGGIFGAAQLFGGSGSLTSVKAECRCVCAKIPQDAVSALMKKDHRFTVNYVTFLSDRIRFLNRKIASFTAGDGRKTLADYLLCLPCSGDRVTIAPNMAQLALSLNMSRPTLYRAMSDLTSRGLIEKNGSAVRIISREKLKSL